MELLLPDQIALDETSVALIEDAEECARRVDEYRPLPPPVVERINDKLLGERVYSSNAIEGNTLDLRETVMILRQGVESGGRKREALEAHNLGDAARTITEWADTKLQYHTPEKLCEVHGLILRDIETECAGRFRERRVMIQGAVRQPPDHVLVPVLVERVMEKLSQPFDVSAILMGTWVHWAIARIHPFQDGNGRLARLWQDLVLCQGGLTCAIIRPTDRKDYLDALGQADEGEINPLVRMVAQRVASAFDTYFSELTADKKVDEWAAELAGEADERLEQKRELLYQRWRRKMETLCREFDLCASRLTDAGRGIKVHMRPYEPIDQRSWENVLSGTGAEKTWLFTLDFDLVGKQRRRYFFFFGKHYPTDLDDERDRAEHRVCLLISEDEGTGQGIRLDHIQSCPIGLREVFVVDGKFVCRVRSAHTGKDGYERDVAPLRIAQDFMRHVILQRMT